MTPIIKFTTGTLPCLNEPEEIMNITDALHWALPFIFNSDLVLKADDQKMFDKASFMLTQARFIEDESPVDYSRNGGRDFKSFGDIIGSQPLADKMAQIEKDVIIAEAERKQTFSGIAVTVGEINTSVCE